jgi:hypothetical protein
LAFSKKSKKVVASAKLFDYKHAHTTETGYGLSVCVAPLPHTILVALDGCSLGVGVDSITLIREFPPGVMGGV